MSRFHYIPGIEDPKLVEQFNNLQERANDLRAGYRGYKPPSKERDKSLTEWTDTITPYAHLLFPTERN